MGPGATIALTRPGGALVRTLAAGVHVLLVSDRSRADNFHLSGPGVDRKTAVTGRAKVTWRVRLNAGVYRYRSDAHPRLRKTFTVNR